MVFWLETDPQTLSSGLLFRLHSLFADIVSVPPLQKIDGTRHVLFCMRRLVLNYHLDLISITAKNAEMGTSYLEDHPS